MNRRFSNSSSQILRIACCVIGAMAAILISPRVVAQQPAFLTNGLVAYYPFDGNTKESRGTGAILSTNGVIYTSNHLGRPNSAAVFQNAIISKETHNFSTGSVRSIAYWYNIESYLGITTSNWGFGQVPAGTPYTSLPGLGWGPSTTSKTSWNPIKPDYGKAWFDSGNGLGFYLIPNTGWHFITCVFDGDISSAKIYFDGKISSLSQYSGSKKVFDQGSSPIFSVGANPRNAFSNYRVWNRSLSDDEIKNIYIYESTPPKLTLITSNPTNITTDLAKDVSFAVSATNASTYQWFKDGNALLSGTNSTLSFTNARPAIIGDYFAVASNAYGTATSSVASLNIKGVDSGIWKGLVAYYLFDSNYTDSTGIAGPLQPQVEGFGALTGDRFSRLNNAFQSESYTENNWVGLYRPDFSLTKSEFTVSVWWKVPDFERKPGVDGRIIEHDWVDDKIRGVICLNVSGASLGKVPWMEAYVGEDMTQGNYGANINAQSDKWNHTLIAVTSQTVSLFLNGKKLATWPAPKSLKMEKRPLFVGGRGWVGAVDDLRIYNRALSEEEAVIVYESERVPDTIIVNQPQSISLTAGAKAAFSVTATNSSPLVSLTYQWQKDGNTIPGATNSSLTITNVQPVNIGEYNVIVSGGFQAVTSASASLGIEGVNSGIWNGLIAFYSFNNSLRDTTSINKNLESVSSSALPIFVNDRFGEPLKAVHNHQNGIDGLRVNDFQFSNNYTFSIWWQYKISPDIKITGQRIAEHQWDNPTGVFSMAVIGEMLQVCFQKSYCTSSQINTNLDWHNTIIVVSTITNSLTGLITYHPRVYLDGELSFDVPVNTAISKPDLSPKSLYIGGRAWFGGIDDVRIYNRALSDSDLKALYENERVPDTIIANQPQAVSLIAGAKAAFSVTATNSSPLVFLTYQWQKDGNPIPGATNSLLTITNVQPVNIGDYNVIVSGGFQAVTSAAAALSIDGVNSGVWKGLVAYYPFDNGLNDHTGLSPDLKSLGTAKKSLGRFGGSDISAESFRDQLNGYSIDLDNNLGLSIKTNITFSMWVYNTPDDRYDLPQNSFPTSYITYYFFHPFDYQYTNIGLLAIHNNFYESSGNNLFFDSLTDPGLKGVGFVKEQYYLKWFHLVAVYENSRNSIYIDGKKVRDGLSGYFGKQFINKNDKIYIGAIPWNLDIKNTHGKMSGSIDDIRIYSRGLSDSDVSALYQSERVPDTVITRQPLSAAVALGGSVRLEVEASNPIATVPIAYQWFKDGAKLVGAINSTLNLGQLRLEQIGTYTVTVDDGSRTLTSTAAYVSLQGVDSSIWNGLIASYTFEGNFNDSTGFGDSLIPFGPVNFVDQGRRPETKAARVSGGDGFLVGSDHAWFSGSEPRTISVWIKPEATSNNSSTVVALGSLENCGQRFALQVPAAQNGIRFDGGDCAADIRSKTFPGSSLSGKWTHAVLTYDGASVRCYVNSLASGSAYAVGLNTDSTAPLVLGNAVGLDGEGFTGLIDDVRIYNRSLSAVEVRSLYLYESSGVAPSLPQITRQPTPLSGYEGETLKLSVEASGYQLGYQWQRGGQNLASDLRLLGINSSELQIKGARLDDGGDYRVLVTNSFGAVTSSTVKLTVVPPVRSLVAGLANEVQEGQRIVFPLSMVSTGDVGGLTFKLNYNPAFLTDPKVEWSAVVGQSVNSVNTTTAGEVSGAFSLAGTALAAGTVPVGTVNFRARSVPMMTNVTLNPVIVSIGNPSGGSLTSGNGAIAGEGRIRPRRIKGDNNANQRVDIGDATVISRLQVGLEEVRFWDVALNDLNGTGDLDNGDIIKSLRTVVGLDPQPGPMGDAKRLSPALVMEPTPVSTNYFADLALLDGPAIKVGQPYRVAVRLKAGRGNLTGLSFSLKYPASLELKERVIGAEIPADALPAWNVSRSRAKLAVIRPKSWVAQSGAVATFTFQPTPEAAKQTKLPISLEEMEVSDAGEGLSAVPSVWLEIGGGLEFVPQLRVMRTSADALSLEILGPKGLPLSLESSEDLSAWSEIQSVSGQGIDAVISVNVTPPESVRAKFWRVTIK